MMILLLVAVVMAIAAIVLSTQAIRYNRKCRAEISQNLNAKIQELETKMKKFVNEAIKKLDDSLQKSFENIVQDIAGKTAGIQADEIVRRLKSEWEADKKALIDNLESKLAQIRIQVALGLGSVDNNVGVVGEAVGKLSKGVVSLVRRVWKKDKQSGGAESSQP